MAGKLAKKLRSGGFDGNLYFRYFRFVILLALLGGRVRGASISWKAGSGVWNTSASNANWTGSTGTYAEGDAVTFPGVDGQANSTITIGNVSGGGIDPGSVTIDSSTTAYTFTLSPINGTGGLLKTGTAVATLAVDGNLYSGSTLINGGTFALQTGATNNIAASKAVTIGANGTLDLTGVTGTGGSGVQGFSLSNGQVIGGTGSVKGSLVVDNPSKISAGTSVALNTGTTNSVGVLKTDKTTFDSGGTYAWKIADNAAGVGAGWDELTMNSLSVTAGTGNNRFVISLSGLNAGAVGSPANVGAGGVYQWVIAKSASPILLNKVAATNGAVLAGLDSSIFKLDTTGFSIGGSQAIAANLSLEAITDGNGQDLALIYNGAPEPGAAFLCAAGALPILMSRRRR